jgi:diguanylate cyclase (GGDEF)-like protein
VLTGLGNRGMLMDRLAFLHSLLNRDPSYAFTVLLLDLDGFKDVNDAFGHEAGDHVLKIIARRLVSLVRKSDTVARMGGDEFVILLYKTSSHEQTDVFVNKLMKAVREPIPWENQELMVSCSVGVMQDIDRCSGSAPGELLRDVDIAMYQAKRSGKNQSRRFSCELRGAVTDNMSLMTELRKSIRENRLEVWHQPIVRISDERLMGTEALLRWYHPSRGLVMPGIFIPLAEEANLIVQLDHWALMLAVEHMKEIRKVVPEAYVSVNFSMRQFLHPNISRLIARTLQTEQIPAGSLAVELTESMLVRNERQLSNAIGNIRATGIRLFLDDFGTGYSSLHRLQELPFDVIKIDQSFIRRVESDDIHIVEAVIRMAHSLGKKVIAEGVESRKQWDILKGLDCDYVQGFLMSKPLPLKELLEWINVRLRSGPVTSS